MNRLPHGRLFSQISQCHIRGLIQTVYFFIVLYLRSAGDHICLWCIQIYGKFRNCNSILLFIEIFFCTFETLFQRRKKFHTKQRNIRLFHKNLPFRNLCHAFQEFFYRFHSFRRFHHNLITCKKYIVSVSSYSRQSIDTYFNSIRFSQNLQRSLRHLFHNSPRLLIHVKHGCQDLLSLHQFQKSFRIISRQINLFFPGIPINRIIAVISSIPIFIFLCPLHKKRYQWTGLRYERFNRMNELQIFPIRNFLMVFYRSCKTEDIFQHIHPVNSKFKTDGDSCVFHNHMWFQTDFSTDIPLDHGKTFDQCTFLKKFLNTACCFSCHSLLYAWYLHQTYLPRMPFCLIIIFQKNRHTVLTDSIIFPESRTAAL